MRGLYILGWAVVFWERLLNAFWPVFCLIALFLTAAFLGLPLSFGPTWHFMFMTGFVLLLTLGIGRGRRLFSLPDPDAVWGRIENDNGLQHRPLAALRDRPAGTQDMTSFRLWQMHLRAAQDILERRRLRPPLPKSTLAVQDPNALRFACLLALLVSFIIAGPGTGQRLAVALTPPAFAKAAPGLSLDAWITPPAYTGLAPIILAGKSAESIAGALPVPTASLLSLRINGLDAEPIVKIGDESLPVKKIAAGSWSLDAKIKDGTRITVRSGLFWPLGSWDIKVIPDAPPMISFAGNPEEDKKSALKLSYAASDDYGVTRIRTFIRRIPLEGETPIPGDVLELPVAPQPPKDETKITTVIHDLTSHPWSGLPVKIKMTATDAAGQTLETEEKDFVLPEREFQHPVARRLISDRRALILQPGRQTRQAAAASVLSFADQPGAYNGDIVAFMALGIAGQRLLYDKTGADTASVIDLLWKTAVRIEDGGLSVARDDLKKILDELVEKLNDPSTSEEELRELMKKLEAKMADYANALNEEMRRTFADQGPPPALPPGVMNQLARRIDMDKVMDHLNNMAATDKREAMKKFLQQMSRMVENLDPKTLKEYTDEQARQMQDLQKLQDVIKGQQKLLDQTNRLPRTAAEQAGQDQPALPGMNPSPSGQGDPAPGDGGTGSDSLGLGRKQRDIRNDLGGVMDEAGAQGRPVPDAFGKADQSMKEAEGDLASGHPQQSIPHQQQALKELNAEMNGRLDQMAKAMEDMMMSMGFMPFGPGGQGGGTGRYDPLGRPGASGNPDTSDVKIPDAQELRRVQKIIEELRRKSGDPSLQRPEKNYIDRLLRQF